MAAFSSSSVLFDLNLGQLREHRGRRPHGIWLAVARSTGRRDLRPSPRLRFDRRSRSCPRGRRAGGDGVRVAWTLDRRRHRPGDAADRRASAATSITDRLRTSDVLGARTPWISGRPPRALGLRGALASSRLSDRGRDRIAASSSAARRDACQPATWPRSEPRFLLAPLLWAHYLVGLLLPADAACRPWPAVGPPPAAPRWLPRAAPAVRRPGRRHPAARSWRARSQRRSAASNTSRSPTWVPERSIVPGRQLQRRRARPGRSGTSPVQARSPRWREATTSRRRRASPARGRRRRSGSA